MTQAEYDLLLRLETGPAIFDPTEPGTDGHEAFQWTVVRLLELRARGWIRLPDGGITRDADGKATLAGPCHLTEAGRRALEDDRRLGPRP
jgi:hypothetical protein